MFLVEGFQKFADIPFGISRIFESLMPQQISANRRKNRSIQVKMTREISGQSVMIKSYRPETMKLKKPLCHYKNLSTNMLYII